jgi:hypothetical protein
MMLCVFLRHFDANTLVGMKQALIDANN